MHSNGGDRPEDHHNNRSRSKSPLSSSNQNYSRKRDVKYYGKHDYKKPYNNNNNKQKYGLGKRERQF